MMNQKLTSKELDAHKGDNLSDKLHCLKVRLGQQPMDYKTFNDTLGMLDALLQSNQVLTTKCKLDESLRFKFKEQSEQLTTTQQKLDVAVEALERIEEGECNCRNRAKYEVCTCSQDTAKAALNIIRGK